MKVITCRRCGEVIKNVFRVGDLTFGSGCIFKIDAEWIRSHYPESEILKAEQGFETARQQFDYPFEIEPPM